MRIGFLTTDFSKILEEDGWPGLGGSGYYRAHLPYVGLQRAGYEVFFGAHLGGDPKTGEFALGTWDGQVFQDLDVVVLHRWMESHAADAIKRAQSTGQIVLNDVDDHFEGLSQANAAFARTDPRRNERSNRAHYLRALEASDGIIASTPFLREWARTHWKRPVALWRNAIDLSLWDSSLNKASMRADKPRVGWVGLTSHRSNDLEEVIFPVNEFLRRHGGTFHHSGALPTLPNIREMIRLDESIRFTSLPPVTFNYVPQLCKGFNIGIVPLSDIPFNTAKSAIKGMEYAAAGIPFVATATPEYEWLRSQGIGLTAKRNKDWLNRLESLADKADREEASKAGILALNPLSITTRTADYVKALEQLTGRTLGTPQSDLKD